MASDKPVIGPVKMNRRIVLQGGGVVVLSAVVPVGCGRSPEQTSPASISAPLGNPPDNPTASATFLTTKQRETLDAFVDRLIPADVDPGALAADCGAFIDAYLAAFLTDPPFIFAGAPFSHRGGHPTNDFLAFVPLDPYEALGWRIVIEGSLGMPEREFNGPVTGLQEIYRDGLTQLNTRAEGQGAACFAELTAAQRDNIINDTSDAAVQALLDVAFPDTLNAMYGPPEYKGNEDLAGWGFTAYDGDTQPRGFDEEQVVNADSPGPLDATLPPSFHENATNANANSNAAPAISKSSAEPTTVIRGQQPGEPTLTDFARADVVGDASLPVWMDANNLSALLASCEGKLSRLREQMKHIAEAYHA